MRDMRLLTALLLPLLFCPSSALADGPFGGGGSSNKKKPFVYQVSKGGKDKKLLMSVFHAVQAIELKGEDEEVRLLVTQKIAPKELLVKYRGSSYWLYTDETYNIVDDEVLKLKVTITNETKKYTTVLGASKTIRVMREAKLTPFLTFTQKDFVRRLKKGDSWVLKQFQEKSCANCFGNGKLSALKNYAKCPDCRGEGSTVIDYTVKW
jgi:DnaJ-class molecular chaperone